MNLTTQPDTTGPLSPIDWRALAPMATLVFLSPVLAELLMGVVHLSNLWLLLPEMGVYGLAALLIREVVRRRQGGWGMILLLGFAYAIAEECVILQTSFTPQFFPPAFAANFGWAFGVQWIYLVAMVWYESVYAIVLPIYFTELLFPGQRDRLWLDRRGLAVAAVFFVLSSIGVWWLWRYVGVQKYGPSTYQIPLRNVGLALIAIIALVSATLLLSPHGRPAPRPPRRTWSPWLVGIMAFGHGLAWFVLIALAYLPATLLPGVSPLLPLIIGVIWVALALLVVKRLSAAPGGGDPQRLALIFGASLASMVGGVLTILTASPLDQISKLVFDVIAVILFVYLAWRLRQRKRMLTEQPL